MGAPLVWTAAAVLAIPSSCLWYAAGRRAHLPYLAGASALLSSVFCWVALDSGDPRDLQRAAGLMVLSSGLLLVEGISLSGALWELSQQGVDLRVVLSPEGARGELFLRF